MVFTLRVVGSVVVRVEVVNGVHDLRKLRAIVCVCVCVYCFDYTVLVMISNIQLIYTCPSHGQRKGFYILFRILVSNDLEGEFVFRSSKIN